MSIAAIVTRGYGNGTFVGSITDAVTAGYTIEPEVGGEGSYQAMRGLTQIGTNGVFFAFTDKTKSLAVLDSTYFNNKYAITTLTDGDILLLEASDGTKWVELSVSGGVISYARELVFT